VLETLAGGKIVVSKMGISDGSVSWSKKLVFSAPSLRSLAIDAAETYL
jgi:hypothetical protein